MKNKTMRASGPNSLHYPEALTDRAVYPTPVGPVCMSKVEHAAYLEELERRGIEPGAYETASARACGDKAR